MKLRLSRMRTKPALGNALLFMFSQLQLRCSTLSSGPQAGSPRSELSAKWAAKNTAIPAFGFEGHISAAVPRGPAPGRSRGRRGPAFDRSYCACPELTMTFFCFLPSNDRTKTGVCFLSFLLRSLRLTKTVLKPKKKKAMQALFQPQWRAPRI